MEQPTLKQLSFLIRENSIKVFPKRKIIANKALASIILFISDILMLSGSIVVTLLLRNLFGGVNIYAGIYPDMLPYILLAFPIVFAFRGLYPGYGKDIIYEIKNLTYSITIVFALLGTLTFLIRGDFAFSRMVFLMSWAISIILVPLARSFVRNTFANKSWWGIPVIIIGAGKAGEEVINALNYQKKIGLQPIVAVDDNPDRWGYYQNVPIIGGLQVIPLLSKQFNVEHSIIAMPSVSSSVQKKIIQNYSRYFKHTTVIPDIFGLSSLWVTNNDLGGFLGLEISQKLLEFSSKFSKRAFDIFLALTLGILSSPLLILTAIIIKIDSKGKVLFKQERMGINRTTFQIYKFRTMRIDAEKRLKDILSEDAVLKAEFEMCHKLKFDPRLTRIGSFLRKYSIDELPQLLNVIKGDMSMIGPRAFMYWESRKMNGNDDIILRVKPGISGMWQITNRNESDFEDRINKDIYYIRNWSMFLDFYIVARTIGVVLLGRNG